MRLAAVLGAVLALMASAHAATSPPAAALKLSACRLKGLEHEARCGVLRRPLDPAHPDRAGFDLHVAVLPALARNKRPDPVFFFAGGPGQSAIALAGPVSGLLARFLNRRDVVLIDQRGTGLSAPLGCDEPAAARPLREQLDPALQARELLRCRDRLQRLPWGDLRWYTTPLAVGDAEAVRQALGLGPVNLVGASYGTRVALEYLRQFPAHVRRVVVDGVAPADLVLMRASATDAQAAFEALLRDCEHEPACHRDHPALRAQWQALWASLPREVTVTQPFTGAEESLRLTRDELASLVRGPLYAPWIASALPLAISEAAAGRFTPLVGLSTGLDSGGPGAGLAMGEHFSVVCSEDFPRLGAAVAPPVPNGVADVGAGVEAQYRQVCAHWPRGALPAAFYQVPVSRSPVLLLSGAIDPVTPPRHAAEVARALGADAVSLVAPQTGHGVMSSLACARELVFHFIDRPDAAQAVSGARREAACLAAVPRPPAFEPPGTDAGKAAGGGR